MRTAAGPCQGLSVRAVGPGQGGDAGWRSPPPLQRGPRGETSPFHSEPPSQTSHPIASCQPGHQELLERGPTEEGAMAKVTTRVRSHVPLGFGDISMK